MSDLVSTNSDLNFVAFLAHSGKISQPIIMHWKRSLFPASEMRWLAKNETGCRPRARLGLSLILSGAAILWLALTFYASTTVSIASPVLKVDGFGNYAFSIVATFVGIGLPVLLMLRPIVAENRSQSNGHKQLTGLPSLLGYMIPAIVILAIFYLLELVIPVSVVPYATAICAVLFTAIGWFQLRGIEIALRITALSAGVLLILSMQFWDWNARKPFLRDIYRVRVEMTVGEVKQIMRGYLNKPEPEDPDPNTQPDDTIIYRPDNEPDYNADWGIITIRAGKVQAVEYSAD